MSGRARIPSDEAARETRLKAALRANLRRRKAQGRDAAATKPHDPGEPGGTPKRPDESGQDEGS